MAKDENEYKTPDLYFAAYLKVAGCPMPKTDRVGKRVFFCFDVGVSNVEELKRGYFSGQSKVPALGYANEIKTLKALCHME